MDFFVVNNGKENFVCLIWSLEQNPATVGVEIQGPVPNIPGIEYYRI